MKKIIIYTTILAFSSISFAQMASLQMTDFDKRITEEQAKQSALRKMEMHSSKRYNVMFGQGQTSSVSGRTCRFAINPPDRATPGTIALTFDDGPNPKTTPLVLDVLKAHNIKATFFILGRKVKGNEALIQRMIDEGHHLANHSWDHPNFHTLTMDVAQKQINRTQTLINMFGESQQYFRYPYGNSNCEINDFLTAEGYKNVGWDVDTCDWAYVDGKVTDKENEVCEARDSERSNYAQYVIRQAKISKGGIMLMHDIHMTTAMSLDEIITKLESENYRFIDIADPVYYPSLQ